ncbi:FAD-dependent monooxygenase [Rubritalea tangerina]|uniref:FAD-dependent monooxygenase n=1 Tax=Rubritalea tangerina TaxID=430798 RepID=A0ABW4Z6P1_9BACT
MKDDLKFEGQAVVIGGSVAGLLAAGVLARHYERVLVIAPDGGKQEVREQPQGHHVHGLLSSGWKAMVGIFPGLEKRLRDAGAEWVHFGKEFRWHHFGHVKAGFDALMEGPFMSRACLEGAIRDELLGCDRIDWVGGKVVGLKGESARVKEVVLDDGREIEADLVVDCSGRGTRLPEWLRGVNGEEVSEELIASDLRYCSCRFSRVEVEGWKALFVIPKPPETRAGAVFPLEDGSWLVTLSGRKGDEMPTDAESFQRYAETLASKEVAEAIREASPLGGSLKHYRFQNSRRYDYGACALPNNLVALGDSVCSFNPLFGQGMTLCALEAEKLDVWLAMGAERSRAYFELIDPLVDHAWEMVMVEDMRHTGLLGERSLKVKCMQWLTERVYAKTAVDGQLTRILYEVIHFERAATDLCKPQHLWRLF